MNPTSTNPPVISPVASNKPISSTLLYSIITLVLLGLNIIAGLLLINGSKENQVRLSHLEALRRNRQNLEQLTTDISTYRPQINKLLGTLPKEADIPEFIQTMNDQAQNLGISLSLNFTSDQPSQTADKLSVIPLKFEMVTTFEKLTQFLDLLGKSKYQIHFSHLDSVAETSSQNLHLILTGQLYVADPFTPH